MYNLQKAMLTRATLLTRRFPPASALTHPHHPTQSILQLLVSPRRIPNTTRLGGRLPAPTRARILARWYSDGAAGAVGQQQQQQERDAGKEKEGEEGEGDGMRREIERRDKEIVELKVCLDLVLFSLTEGVLLAVAWSKGGGSDER